MSHLPEELSNAIHDEIHSMTLGVLHRSHEELKLRYRDLGRRHAIEDSEGRFIETQGQRLAYLATRMPATYAAVHKALTEVKARLPGISFESLFDLGAGPGTVLWAASDLFPELKQATLLEQDQEMVLLAKRLASKGKGPVFKHAEWQVQGLLNLTGIPPHDLVVLSYVLGELPPDQLDKIMEMAWKAARKAVVCIEPGTPRGFQAIWKERERLIGMGASIAAPCPHANACPMKEAGDWCHFSARLERTSEHRILKEGQLGYEDEKYSYVAGVKVPIEPYQYRILRHPQKRSGHINFILCSSDGLKQKTISRRDGDAYKRAKKLEWGDIL